MDENNKKNKIKIAIAVAALAVIIIIILLIAFSCNDDVGPVKDSESTDTYPILPPDYPIRETETDLEPVTDDHGGGQQGGSTGDESGGSVNLTYSTVFKVDLSDKELTFQYSNPSSSNQDVAIAVMIQDVKIAESALIPAGNMIRRLPLVDGVENQLQVGTYNAELVFYFYDTKTGEKAMVDAKALIEVEVRE